MGELPAKSPVVGLPISLTSYDETLDAIGARSADHPMVIAVCNVHSVMSARTSPELFDAISNAAIATPDGMPVVWTLRRTVDSRQPRVYGPELMRRAFDHGVERDWKHYLYGSTPDTIRSLRDAIETMDPRVQVVGSESPPFRPLATLDYERAIQRIASSGADIVWVGLGMPKQELWMDEMRHRLPGVALVGVGAAFDLLAGTIRQAPRWIQRSGLEWLFRLSQEPRRLWRRYAWNNPAFLFLAAAQILRLRLGTVVTRPDS